MKTRRISGLSTLFINAVLLGFWMGTASGVEAELESGSFNEYLPIIASEPPIYISELITYDTPGGNTRFVGELMNISSIPIYDVIIRIWYEDVNGQMHEFFYSPVFPATLPGQPNPFDMTLFDPGVEIEEGGVDISSWSVEDDKIIGGATILSILVEDHSSYAIVTTTIRNDQIEPLYNMVGFAWSLNTWSSFESQPVVDVLLPGETVEFSTFLDGPGPSEANIKAAAQGELGP